MSVALSEGTVSLKCFFFIFGWLTNRSDPQHCGLSSAVVWAVSLSIMPSYFLILNNYIKIYTILFELAVFSRKG